MLNKWIGMGRLTADPQLAQTQSGVSVCKFTVAVNRNYKGVNGEQQADFINCVAWRSSAEFVSKYFSKGNMIIIEGSLQNNNYTDANGVKRYEMIVNVENAQFGESKSSQNNSQPTVQNNDNSQPTVQNNQNDDNSVGDLSGYEEILSDGDEMPF